MKKITNLKTSKAGSRSQPSIKATSTCQNPNAITLSLTSSPPYSLISGLYRFFVESVGQRIPIKLKTPISLQTAPFSISPKKESCRIGGYYRWWRVSKRYRDGGWEDGKDVHGEIQMIISLLEEVGYGASAVV
ncbi:hypothetical protein NC651_000013 [Populus alba x Populus x berolinensis]|nr:hypothetical protein NC651_000013 [Populus alba x Populus x berolinensis]